MPSSHNNSPIISNQQAMTFLVPYYLSSAMLSLVQVVQFELQASPLHLRHLKITVNVFIAAAVGQYVGFLLDS
ncbi:hypothetical protein V1522DRAFT_275329 [Lipomyces starkeyi]